MTTSEPVVTDELRGVWDVRPEGKEGGLVMKLGIFGWGPDGRGWICMADRMIGVIGRRRRRRRRRRKRNR